MEAGYSILTYDRLGTGESEKPDADTVVQVQLELEVLRSISEMARDGLLLESSSHPSQGTIFTKNIHVGHSFGTFLSTGPGATYGDRNISGALVLTGFTPNAHIHTILASYFDFQITEGDPSGYLTVGSKTAVQRLFLSDRPTNLTNTTFSIGGFEPAILTYTNRIKQTITVGEHSSGRYVNECPGLDYTGAVLYQTAEWDFVACGGQCTGGYTLELLPSIWTAASIVNDILMPGNGHGLTMHRNAKEGYTKIFEVVGQEWALKLSMQSWHLS